MNSFLLHYILYILISKCSFLQICNCNFLFPLRPHTSIDTGLLFIYFFPKHLRAGFYVFILKMRRKSIEPSHSYETGMVKLVWINLRLSAGGSGNDSLKPKVTLIEENKIIFPFMLFFSGLWHGNTQWLVYRPGLITRMEAFISYKNLCCYMVSFSILVPNFRDVESIFTLIFILLRWPILDTFTVHSSKFCLISWNWFRQQMLASSCNASICHSVDSSFLIMEMTL